MNQDDHALATGRIIGNLQALESLIRLFLCEAAGQDIEFPTGAPSSMKDSYMANYLSLRQLIECYNRQLTKAETDCSIDMDAVQIRDTIAHGRLMSSSQSFPLTLYKFGMPRSGTVPVEFTETLTADRLVLGRATPCGNPAGFIDRQVFGPRSAVVAAVDLSGRPARSCHRRAV